MQLIEWLVLLALLAGLAASVWLIVIVEIRRSRAPDDGGARFAAYWGGAVGFLSGLACCCSIIALVADHVGSYWPATVLAVLVHALIRLIDFLFCSMGVHKIVHGVRGHVWYCGKRVPDAEMTDLTLGERRAFALYCVAQGVFGLGLGGGLGFLGAAPFLP